MSKFSIRRFCRALCYIATDADRSTLKLVAKAFLLKPRHLVSLLVYLHAILNCILPYFIVPKIWLRPPPSRSG